MTAEVDKKSQEWSSAHAGAAGFYAIPRVDETFFVKHMQSPVVSAIVAIGRAQQRQLRILEIGCGSGVDSVCLALYGHDVTTLDVSDHLLAEARSLSSRAAKLFAARPLQLRFVRGDVFDLQQYAGQYDVVLSFGVVVIWREGARRLEALANMRAALREDGWLLLGTTNTLNPLFKLIPLTPLVTDLADYNLRLMEVEVRQSGFAVTERGAVGLSENFEQWLAYSFERVPLKMANWVFERLPRKLQLPVAPHVFVVAKKGTQ